MEKFQQLQFPLITKKNGAETEWEAERDEGSRYREEKHMVMKEYL